MKATPKRSAPKKLGRQMPSGRPFPRGRSGNPGGRPREFKELQRLAQEHTEGAIEALAEIMQTGSDAARVAAANALLDRGYGKPPVAVTVDTSAAETPSAQVARDIANAHPELADLVFGVGLLAAADNC